MKELQYYLDNTEDNSTDDLLSLDDSDYDNENNHNLVENLNLSKFNKKNIPNIFNQNIPSGNSQNSIQQPIQQPIQNYKQNVPNVGCELRYNSACMNVLKNINDHLN